MMGGGCLFYRKGILPHPYSAGTLPKGVCVEPVYGFSLISCYIKWLPFYWGLSYMWLFYLYNTVKIKTLRRGLLGKDTVFAVDALGVDALGKGTLLGRCPK